MMDNIKNGVKIMSNALQDFAQVFKQHIESNVSTGNEEVSIKTFVDVTAGFLHEAGEIGIVEVCDFKRLGIQLNGYATHEDEDEMIIALDLIVCLQTKIVPPISISKNEWDPVLKRAIGFLKKSLSGLHHALIDDSDVYAISKQIFDSKEKISQVRVFFLTDGVTKSIQLEDIEIEGIPTSFHVWDLERIYRMRSSGSKKEPVVIDLEHYNEMLPCLPMPILNEDYDSYLIIVPGILLAKIYRDFGERLIERNVRSFLQVKGINKDIRKTIIKEPHMFLAYNNGISATAEQIEFSNGNGVQFPTIRLIKDLQIVNGGQTTASIYNVFQKEKDVDISKVYVQMKLTIIKDPEKIEEMVPTISFCANSQNKIQSDDFFSNRPFHRKMEQFSRNEWAPAREGTNRQTKWFYERARGSYLDMKNKQATPAKKKLFEEDHPKKQSFTKTDLAKFIIAWEQLPHIVSRGPRKNFDFFTKSIQNLDVEQLDIKYFKDTIAKAIIFNTINDLVTTKNRANIVTYTMAWLSYKMQNQIDLEEIWKKQAVPLFMMDTIKLVINAAHAHITNSPNGELYSEWSKREECWTSFRDMSIEKFLSL